MKRCTLLLVALFLLSFPALTGAETVNLWTDFPDNQGDNGFYAYAYQPGRDQPYRLLNDVAPNNYDFNTPKTQYGQFGNYPRICRLDSGPHTGSVLMMPSGNPQIGTYFGPEDAVLTWVVPENNTYDIIGSFEHVQYQATDSNGTFVSIRINDGSPIWSHDVLLKETQSFNLQDIPLNLGDKLYFCINAISHDWSDESVLRGSIEYTHIPLPPSALLLGSGLLGLSGLGLMRRKKG